MNVPSYAHARREAGSTWGLTGMCMRMESMQVRRAWGPLPRPSPFLQPAAAAPIKMAAWSQELPSRQEANLGPLAVSEVPVKRQTPPFALSLRAAGPS